MPTGGTGEAAQRRGLGVLLDPLGKKDRDLLLVQMPTARTRPFDFNANLDLHTSQYNRAG